MQHRAKRAASGRGFAPLVTLLIFVVLSGLAHHAGYAMEPEVGGLAGHGQHQLAADQCHGDGCLDHRDGQLGCCASGFCGASLPASGSVAGLAPASAFPHLPAEIGPRWINAGLERPPKAA